jgi:hypothetical protein
MSLEGPAFVLSWRGAVQAESSGVVDPARVATLAQLPYQLHVDHPEGIELWPEGGPGALLIIYDAPSPERTDADAFAVLADVIRPAADQNEPDRRSTDGQGRRWLQVEVEGRRGGGGAPGEFTLRDRGDRAFRDIHGRCKPARNGGETTPGRDRWPRRTA